MAEETTEANFRLTAKRFMLTYKTHIPKEELEQLIAEKCPIKWFRAAHETSDKANAYEHTHAVVELAKAPNFKDPRVFDFKGIHPNFRLAGRGNTGFNNLKKYIAKQDPDNADLNKSFAEIVWEHDTVQDMLKETPVDQITTALKVWECKPQPEIEPPHLEMRPWEVDLMALLAQPPDRRIFWILDKTGGAGKTTFGMYLEDTQGALYLSQFGGARDSATVIQTAVESGWNGALCIVDLPRQVKDRAIYEPIEMIKNGRMTALKYRGGRLRWRPGKVVVFANFAPYPGEWSEDRYSVWEIQPGPPGQASASGVGRLTETLERSVKPFKGE